MSAGPGSSSEPLEVVPQSEEELSLSSSFLEVVSDRDDASDETTPGTGSLVGRYRLLHELGRGAMAQVHAAVAHGPGGFEHLFAIKTLLEGYAQNHDFITMLLDEARLGAAIHHRNVVETIDVGTDERWGPYLVMQYVQGVTLAVLVRMAREQGRRLPVRVVTRMIADMLEGLSAAHQVRGPDGELMHIVHRDVSPQNVLVGTDGIAKVADFGIAKAKARLTTTRAGQFKGKASYSAPEHVAGERIDARADVFSAGVMLWEGLTGQRLFKGAVTSTMHRVLNEPIPWVSRMASGLEHFDAVVDRALERDVRRRFQSADVFLEELLRVAEGSDGVGTHREVAEFVETVCGSVIDEERRAVARMRGVASQRAKDATRPTPIRPPEATTASESVEVNMGSGSFDSDRNEATVPRIVVAPPPPEPPKETPLPVIWIASAVAGLAAAAVAGVVVVFALDPHEAVAAPRVSLPESAIEASAVAEPVRVERPIAPAITRALAPVEVIEPTLPTAAAPPVAEPTPPQTVPVPPPRRRLVATRVVAAPAEPAEPEIEANDAAPALAQAQETATAETNAPPAAPPSAPEPSTPPIPETTAVSAPAAPSPPVASSL